MLQQHSYGNSAMPLLMGFTPQCKIQECMVDESFAYNDLLQITEYNMRTVGTKCMKIVGNTSKGPGKGYTIDKKNEIDDSKTVK